MSGNPERLRHIADVIEANPDHFSMTSFFGFRGSQDLQWPSLIAGASQHDFVNECGTTACIAGWAFLEYRDEFVQPVGPSSERNSNEWEVSMGRLLGFDNYDDCYALFYNWDLESPEEAAAHLREMAGEIEAEQADQPVLE